MNPNKIERWLSDTTNIRIVNGYQTNFRQIELPGKYISAMDCDAKWEDQKMITPVSRRYKETYIFQFPTKDILKVNFSSPQYVTNYLIKHALSVGYYQGQLYDKRVEIIDCRPHYIYECCRRTCGSLLDYQRRGDMLYLVQFRNIHSHKLKLTPKKAKTHEIRQHLMDLPAQDNIESHIEAVKAKFNLSRQQAKYIKSKLFWRFDNPQQLLEKLSQRNVQFRRNPDKGILVLCSQSMKSGYLRYGDLLCFDITYKLLKKKKKQQKHVGVGFFVGQDENTRIVLFGMCTIVNQCSEDFRLVFGYFFDMMRCQVPQTILTDDQGALVSALETLKQQNEYSYNHMLDWYHKIEAIKRRIRRQQNNQILFPLFCRILKQPSKQIYSSIVLEIANFLNKPNIMCQFLKEQHKYVLSQVPCSFFGFGVSSTRAQSMNNLIKRSVAHQTNLGKLVFFVLRVEIRLIKNMNLLALTNDLLLQNIQDQEIVCLSKSMEYLAFDQIRQYYEASLEQEIALVDACSATVPYVKYDRAYQFNLKYVPWKQCWVCECNAIYKTGLPCSHLIKVVRKFQGCIGYYVNERWLHNKNDLQHQVKMMRPPIAKNRRRI